MSKCSISQYTETFEIEYAYMLAPCMGNMGNYIGNLFDKTSQGISILASFMMMHIFSSGHIFIIPNTDIMHVQYTNILDETCLNQSIRRDA